MYAVFYILCLVYLIFRHIGSTKISVSKIGYHYDSILVLNLRNTHSFLFAEHIFQFSSCPLFICFFLFLDKLAVAPSEFLIQTWILVQTNYHCFAKFLRNIELSYSFSTIFFEIEIFHRDFPRRTYRPRKFQKSHLHRKNEIYYSPRSFHNFVYVTVTPFFFQRLSSTIFCTMTLFNVNDVAYRRKKLIKTCLPSSTKKRSLMKRELLTS